MSTPCTTHQLSRRKFSQAAAVIAAGLGVSACGRKAPVPLDASLEYKSQLAAGPALNEKDHIKLSADSNAGQVNLLAYQPAPHMDKSIVSVNLPLGSVVNISDPTWGAVVYRNNAQNSLNISNFGIVELNHMKFFPLEIKQVGIDNMQPFDFAVSSQLMVWSEYNYETGSWALYATTFNDKLVQTQRAYRLDMWKAGDENPRVVPEFCVCGTSVVWQTGPTREKYIELAPDPAHGIGDKEIEEHKKRAQAKVQGEYKAYWWSAGMQSPQELVSSKRAFATNPTLSGASINPSTCVVTLTPYIKFGESSHYAVASYTMNNGREVERLPMYKAIKPYAACYIDNQSALCVEGHYGYGGILGEMGSYAHVREGGVIWAVGREPLATQVYVNGFYCVKNRNSTLVFDMHTKSYCRLYAPDNATDWGDYPAVTGDAAFYWCYATIKEHGAGAPVKVVLRKIELEAFSSTQEKVQDQSFIPSDAQTTAPLNP